MPKVKFINDSKEIEVPAGSNLRAEARKAGIQVYGGIDKFLNCRGLGLCGTCRVLVKKGMENLSSKGRMERFTLGKSLAAIGHEDEIRLSCQCAVNGDCEVQTRVPLQISPETDAKGKY